MDFDQFEGCDNNNQGNKCVNIYKNLVRDIKMFYTLRFEQFKKGLKLKLTNKTVNDILFPLLIKEFVDSEFDTNLLHIFKNKFSE